MDNTNKNPDPSVVEFEALTKKMLDTYSKKNHDYGNSFEQSLNEEGIVASRVRIGDKYNRYKTLTKGNNVIPGVNLLVKDESVKDTLLDMATYCIMTVMWMDKNGK